MTEPTEDGQEEPTGFGLPNWVTFIRLLIAAFIGGLACPAAATGTLGADVAWVWFAVTLVALACDGVDGWLARRLDRETSFGARFDMETDAFLMLVLSLLAWLMGKAGPWVLAIGLMRYVFVGAGMLWPRLNSALPESLRRKGVCVFAVAALAILIAPVVTLPESEFLAIAALALLIYSFAVDTAWLVRQPQ
jgi:phosphatidylglycerophosphate synthase